MWSLPSVSTLLESLLCTDVEAGSSLTTSSSYLDFSQPSGLHGVLKTGVPSCSSQGVQFSWPIALYYYLFQNVAQLKMLSGLAHSISSFKQAALECVKKYNVRL